MIDPDSQERCSIAEVFLSKKCISSVHRFQSNSEIRLWSLRWSFSFPVEPVNQLPLKRQDKALNEKKGSKICWLTQLVVSEHMVFPMILVEPEQLCNLVMTSTWFQNPFLNVCPDAAAHTVCSVSLSVFLWMWRVCCRFNRFYMATEWAECHSKTLVSNIK